MLVLAYAGVIGLAIGSFLNVVIFRYNSGRGIAGRSFCGSCARKLAWYELVPLLSFAALRGRCRTCRARISWQYFLVELFTAVVFVLAHAHFLQSLPGSDRWVVIATQLLCWPLLIVIFIYDLKHKIIPDALAYGFAGVALAASLTSAFFNGFSPLAVMNLAAGPVLFIPFFLLWYLSGGRLMGLGDGKLAIGIGWFLGMSGGVSAILFGFWAGAIVGLASMAFQKVRRARATMTMKSEVPFAPFLVAGIFAVSFFGFSAFTLIPLLS